MRKCNVNKWELIGECSMLDIDQIIYESAEDARGPKTQNVTPVYTVNNPHICGYGCWMRSVIYRGHLYIYGGENAPTIGWKYMPRTGGKE